MSNSIKFHSRTLFQTRVMPYNMGCGVEKSMDPSSRTQAWTPSVLILRGLWDVHKNMQCAARRGLSARLSFLGMTIALVGV